MCDRSEEVIIETFPRRNDTPFFTTRSCRLMVKMEAFEDSHFMPQAVRVGLTDHTGSIVSLMACIFDLKNTFLCNRKLMKIVLSLWTIALVW